MSHRLFEHEQDLEDRNFSRTEDILGPGIDDAAHAKALLRTADLAKKISAIARAAELPDEAIPCLFDVYKNEVIQVVCEARAPKMTNRVPICIDSGEIKITPLQSAHISAPCSWRDYRVEEIHIEGDVSRWQITDMLVGNQTQLANYSMKPIRGERLADVLKELRLEPCLRGMHFTIVVTYVGPEADGEVFRAIAIGPRAR